jgi:hypothetical protein
MWDYIAFNLFAALACDLVLTGLLGWKVYLAAAQFSRRLLDSLLLPFRLETLN